MFKRIECPLYGLKAEVRHSDMLSIGIGQCDADATIPIFPYGADFSLYEFVSGCSGF
jgi:hypothetical protein